VRGSSSIAEIANDSGYQFVYAITKKFKRLIGQAPGGYRKQRLST